jgi:hypothetical protein
MVAVQHPGSRRDLHRSASRVQRSFAQSESPLQPIAMLPEMERVPTIPGFDISGPFNVTGVSETASRRRFQPTSAAEESRAPGPLSITQAAFLRPS